jgi:nitric oxide reductase subunit B
MPLHIRLYTKFVFLLLLATLVFGMLSSWAYLFPESFNQYLPFYQLRPIHTSAALFFIISAATLCIILFHKDTLGRDATTAVFEKIFITTWIATILVIFTYYGFRQFGGREYWEFPAWLSIPLLFSWVSLMIGYYKGWLKCADKKLLYIWMWSTGILFFFITFIEQNLWQISWFRQSFLRELTVQWKANGSMVGAWNQMIYGSSLFLMVMISGDKTIARSKKAFFFYFLGLTNLMFNWGHHIYNLPAHGAIRHISYIISMTEWLIFISIIQGFKNKLGEARKLRHLLPYKFLIAAEFWVFANLLLALFMSIPAVNRYTHGTHITVAHAMGTTIGINTMILLGVLGYALDIDQKIKSGRKLFTSAYNLAQVSLLIFWLSLIAAGILKGYRSVALNMTVFQEMMVPVNNVLKLFAVTGIGVAIGIAIIVVQYWQAADKSNRIVKDVK